MLDPAPSLGNQDVAPEALAAPAVLLGQEPSRPLTEPNRAPFRGSRAKALVAHCLLLARAATRTDRALLAALLVADAVMIAGYVAFAYAEHYGIRGSLFYGNLNFSFVDGGYPEIYGYAKQVLIALLLLATHATTRQAVYRMLALLFAVCVLDDSLALHEAFGAYLAAHAGIPARVGELVGWGVIGLAPVLAVLAGYRRSDARSRADAEAVLAGFAILLFFAVGMDVVHGVIGRFVSGFQTVLTIAEDGGELFALTLICALSLGIFRRRRASAPDRAA
jgi:hypothetical protein